MIQRSTSQDKTKTKSVIFNSTPIEIASSPNKGKSTNSVFGSLRGNGFISKRAASALDRFVNRNEQQQRDPREEKISARLREVQQQIIRKKVHTIFMIQTQYGGIIFLII